MTTLRRPYQYMVAMLCILYGESDASKSPLSYIPLIYYFIDKGLSFNWDDILSTNLMESITIMIYTQLGTFELPHVVVSHKHHVRIPLIPKYGLGMVANKFIHSYILQSCMGA
jgi:hypothetical protein